MNAAQRPIAELKTKQGGDLAIPALFFSSMKPPGFAKIPWCADSLVCVGGDACRILLEDHLNAAILLASAWIVVACDRRAFALA
jgi:hypothetical protein